MKSNTEKYNRILIRNGTIFDGNDLFVSDILVSNGVISKISNNINESADFYFDAKNMIISSGLTDIHTHIKGISPSEIGIDCEKISRPLGISHLIDASAEIGDINNTVTDDADISVLSRVHIFGNKANFDLTEEIIKKYSDRVIGLKVYFDASFTDVSDARPLAEICEYARKRNLFVMVHTTNSPVSMLDIVNTLGKGDIVSHVFHGGKNNAAEDDFCALKTAKEKGVLLDSAYSVNYHVDYSIFKDAVSKNILPDFISSDITQGQEIICSEKYGLPMCMSIAEECGMNTEDVFRCVTVNPMKLLRVEDNRGYLKVGNRADIAVFKTTETDIKLTDRYANTVALDKIYKCLFTVKENELLFNR